MSDATIADLMIRLAAVRAKIREAQRVPGVPPACAERLAEAAERALIRPARPTLAVHRLSGLLRVWTLLQAGQPSDIAAAARIVDSMVSAEMMRSQGVDVVTGCRNEEMDT